MKQKEYNNIDWHRGNHVRLTNGKEYKVSIVRKRLLILKSEEYDTHFLVLPNIIEERTSDFIDTEVKKAKPTAPAQQEVKAEPQAPVTETTPVTEEPKPKRKRVRIPVSAMPKYEKASLYKSKK